MHKFTLHVVCLKAKESEINWEKLIYMLCFLSQSDSYQRGSKWWDEV